MLHFFMWKKAYEKETSHIIPKDYFCLKSSRTFFHTTNFRLWQTERVRDINLKFDENGVKLSKKVKNIVGKGEITV